jgi:hypothetical protein
MTAGASMLAMTRRRPPQPRQITMSMANTLKAPCPGQAPLPVGGRCLAAADGENGVVGAAYCDAGTGAIEPPTMIQPASSRRNAATRREGFSVVSPSYGSTIQVTVK